MGEAPSSPARRAALPAAGVRPRPRPRGALATEPEL